ncbi:alcohol dehydrogenase 3-like isoform X1 [Malus domestica]|uniref:alcohol dehydrogenase 3-like isoform X1 n=1 Tax=Malus domestica TaxID=3750 RepID=UPI000498D8AB|nr:alcohol dehydrogenase 3-like isoform X1 [Malus domestica]XP_028943417.1 alcohol dehydrogenase 3-like isoform X1 [Malus domestica]
MQNQPSFLHKKMDFATAVAWEAGKLLVTERVKIAPPKAMEMRIKVKYTSVYHTELYFCRRFGFPSQCSKTKNYPQMLFIGLAVTEGGKIPEALEYWGGVGGLEAQEV